MKQGLDIATKALALCAGAFLFGSTAWAKDEPLVLKQSDKWVANFDTESCNLATAFGTDESQVFARFTRFEPADPFYLELIGKPVKVSDSHSRVKIGFGPIGKLREVETSNGTLGKLPLMILGTFDFQNREVSHDEIYPPITEEQEAAVTSIDVVIPGKKPLRLTMGSMARPMRVMRTCTTTLIKSWGYDPDQQAKLSRRAAPIGKPDNWLRTVDYPNKMVMSGGQGIVQFRLDVEASGAVSGCHILQRSNPDEFADLSCKLVLKRARMTPALDQAGIPIKSFYINRVVWVMGR